MRISKKKGEPTARGMHRLSFFSAVDSQQYNYYCRLLLWLYGKFLSAIVHGQMIISASKYTIRRKLLAKLLWCLL